MDLGCQVSNVMDPDDFVAVGLNDITGAGEGTEMFLGQLVEKNSTGAECR